MMKKLLLPVLPFLLMAASVTAQNKSVYTSTKTRDCKTIATFPEEGGSYIGECRGVGGYKVQLIEGDIRQTLNIITPANKKFELKFWDFYLSFSYIGPTIEWRTKAGSPVALIARFNVANSHGDLQKTTSYLMVSKIGKNAACITDIVPPGTSQNEEARTLADAAAEKPCKKAN